MRRIVYTSSRAVYGPLMGEHGAPAYVPVRESHPLSGSNLYAITKVAGESVGRWFAASTPLEFVSLRFATIYGPGKSDRHGAFSTYTPLIERPISGETVRLDGAQHRDDAIYVADAARAVIAALDAAELWRAAYNIGTGRTVSLADFADAVRKVIPGADIALGEGRDPLGLGGNLYGALDSSLAKEELGWKPVWDLQSGVTDYVARFTDDPQFH